MACQRSIAQRIESDDGGNGKKRGEESKSEQYKDNKNVNNFKLFE